MTPNRKVYKVKRYYGRKRGFSLGRFIGERKVLFAGIAAAVVVVVVLFATGVFAGLQAQDTPVDAQATAAALTPSDSPSATPSPLATASSTDSASASPSASPSAARELKLTNPHMQGDDVRALQEKLGITADGSFGPSTRDALISYQEENGLPADGIAGPETLAKLGL